MGLLDRVRRWLPWVSSDAGGDSAASDVGESATAGRWGRPSDDAYDVPDADEREGSHGNHWNTVVPDNAAIRDALMTSIEDGDVVETAHEGVVGHVPPSGPLRPTAITQDGSVVSGYPLGDGVVHRARLRDVLAWESGLEAQIRVDLADASLWFFDAEYYRGDDRTPGTEYAVELAAFAYRLEDASDEVVTDESGTEYSLSGAAGVFPFDGGDVDDYVFNSVAERVHTVDFQGETVHRVRMPLFRTEDGASVDVWCYAGANATGDYRPQPGDDVGGVLWLQGRVRPTG